MGWIRVILTVSTLVFTLAAGKLMPVAGYHALFPVAP